MEIFELRDGLSSVLGELLPPAIAPACCSLSFLAMAASCLTGMVWHRRIASSISVDSGAGSRIFDMEVIDVEAVTVNDTHIHTHQLFGTWKHTWTHKDARNPMHESWQLATHRQAAYSERDLAAQGAVPVGAKLSRA